LLPGRLASGRFPSSLLSSCHFEFSDNCAKFARSPLFIVMVRDAVSKYSSRLQDLSDFLHS
jgi:hypothetical protein